MLVKNEQNLIIFSIKVMHCASKLNCIYSIVMAKTRVDLLLFLFIKI